MGVVIAPWASPVYCNAYTSGSVSVYTNSISSPSIIDMVRKPESLGSNPGRSTHFFFSFLFSYCYIRYLVHLHTWFSLPLPVWKLGGFICDIFFCFVGPLLHTR